MSRRYDLDWVRVAAFALLVCYHVGMYYVSWDWHVKSPFASTALEPLMFLTAPWRLSLLFFIAGVATAFFAANRPDGFIGARSWRLLVPLLFGMLVVVTPQAYYQVLDSASGYHDGYLAFWGRYLAGDGSFCDADDCLDLPTWNHLWFVAYLWVYTLLLWGLRRGLSRPLTAVSVRLQRWGSGAAVLVVPALFLAAARLLLVGRFESTHALVDDWYNHAQYLPLFLLGYALAKADAVWERIEQLRWPALVIALPCYLLLAWYFSAFTDTQPAPDWLRMSQRVAWGVNQWATIVAILGFARRHLRHDSAALRYLSDAVFPVYILHQTLIVVLAYNLRPAALPPLLEGPLLVVATFMTCFAGYELIRRVAWLRPLFGLKMRAASPSLQAVASPATP